ncbi:MAG: NADH-quinone oxidoreductase subunit I, partial [Eggerthellaceae bacterium]
RCPTGCITVDKEAESWTINPFDCIQCRTCVRECPQHCLTMMPEYRKPAFEKVVSVTTKPEPTEEEKAELARKEAEKAAELRRRWKRKLHVKKLSRNKLAKRLKLRLPI